MEILYNSRRDQVSRTFVLPHIARANLANQQKFLTLDHGGSSQRTHGDLVQQQFIARDPVGPSLSSHDDLIKQQQDTNEQVLPHIPSILDQRAPGNLINNDQFVLPHAARANLANQQQFSTLDSVGSSQRHHEDLVQQQFIPHDQNVHLKRTQGNQIQQQNVHSERTPGNLVQQQFIPHDQNVHSQRTHGNLVQQQHNSVDQFSPEQQRNQFILPHQAGANTAKQQFSTVDQASHSDLRDQQLKTHDPSSQSSQVVSSHPSSHLDTFYQDYQDYQSYDYQDYQSFDPVVSSHPSHSDPVNQQTVNAPVQSHTAQFSYDPRHQHQGKYSLHYDDNAGNFYFFSRGN